MNPAAERVKRRKSAPTGPQSRISAPPGPSTPPAITPGREKDHKVQDRPHSRQPRCSRQSHLTSRHSRPTVPTSSPTPSATATPTPPRRRTTSPSTRPTRPTPRPGPRARPARLPSRPPSGGGLARHPLPAEHHPPPHPAPHQAPHPRRPPGTGRVLILAPSGDHLIESCHTPGRRRLDQGQLPAVPLRHRRGRPAPIAQDTPARDTPGPRPHRRHPPPPPPTHEEMPGQITADHPPDSCPPRAGSAPSSKTSSPATSPSKGQADVFTPSAAPAPESPKSTDHAAPPKTGTPAISRRRPARTGITRHDAQAGRRQNDRPYLIPRIRPPRVRLPPVRLNPRSVPRRRPPHQHADHQRRPIRQHRQIRRHRPHPKSPRIPRPRGPAPPRPTRGRNTRTHRTRLPPLFPDIPLNLPPTPEQARTAKRPTGGQTTKTADNRHPHQNGNTHLLSTTSTSTTKPARSPKTPKIPQPSQFHQTLSAPSTAQ